MVREKKPEKPLAEPEIPLDKPPIPTIPFNSPAVGKIRLIVSGPVVVKTTDPRIVVERR